MDSYEQCGQPDAGPSLVSAFSAQGYLALGRFGGCRGCLAHLSHFLSLPLIRARFCVILRHLHDARNRLAAAGMPEWRS
jgi:hypothetical protein